MTSPYVVRPIGFVRTPFVDKVQAPRQPSVGQGAGAAGTIEVLPEYKDAIDDLDGFSRIWVLFWFDRAHSSRMKVTPPRSEKKRGVFATRSPHRPNPIGLSVVRLDRIENCTIHISDLDILDSTPVLDIKPYLPYADAFVDASSGWLDARDPQPSWNVHIAPLVSEQLQWLAREGLDFDLGARITEALALGPKPHAYRRIRTADSGELELAVKQWRARFVISSESSRDHDASTNAILVTCIVSGFRQRDLDTSDAAELTIHRKFVAEFGRR